MDKTWESSLIPRIDLNSGLELGFFGISSWIYPTNRYICRGCCGISRFKDDLYPWPSGSILSEFKESPKYLVTRYFHQSEGYTSYWSEDYCKDCCEELFNSKPCKDCTLKLDSVCGESIYHSRDQTCKSRFLTRKSARNLEINS